MICTECIEGMVINDSYQCEVKKEDNVVSAEVQSATKAAQAAAGSGAAAGVAVAFLNMSSPVAIWAILNQMQLFILLSLIK